MNYSERCEAKVRIGQRCVRCGRRVFRWHRQRFLGVDVAPPWHHRCALYVHGDFWDHRVRGGEKP